MGELSGGRRKVYSQGMAFLLALAGRVEQRLLHHHARVCPGDVGVTARPPATVADRRRAVLVVGRSRASTLDAAGACSGDARPPPGRAAATVGASAGGRDVSQRASPPPLRRLAGPRTGIVTADAVCPGERSMRSILTYYAMSTPSATMPDRDRIADLPTWSSRAPARRAASSTVTAEPRRRWAWAISRPIGPPPITTRWSIFSPLSNSARIGEERASRRDRGIGGTASGRSRWRSTKAARGDPLPAGPPRSSRRGKPGGGPRSRYAEPRGSVGAVGRARNAGDERPTTWARTFRWSIDGSWPLNAEPAAGGGNRLRGVGGGDQGLGGHAAVVEAQSPAPSCASRISTKPRAPSCAAPAGRTERPPKTARQMTQMSAWRDLGADGAVMGGHSGRGLGGRPVRAAVSRGEECLNPAAQRHETDGITAQVPVSS